MASNFISTTSSGAGFDELVASATFSGSLLSFLATSVVLASYVYYRDEQRSFRHALVFNLALAEFVNTLNNTISGIIYLRDHKLQPGLACTINGFVGQLSVQASDFSILTIALVTFLTVTRTAYLPNASSSRKIMICMSVWIVPLTTATIATAMGIMVPVSGNWCWISSDHSNIRYALTHGWRIGIIFVTAGIYLYIWWYMNRHFRTMVTTFSSELSNSTQASRRKRKGFKMMKDKGDPEETGTEMTAVSNSGLPQFAGDWKVTSPDAAYVRDSLDRDLEHGDEIGRELPADATATPKAGHDSTDYNNFLRPPPAFPASGPVGLDTVASEFPHRKESRKVEYEIKRMMLLNAYPIMYVLLWIPGLVNRLMEATGHTSDSRALAALQASSQFVGLANALTYGFNRALRGKVKLWWRERQRARRRSKQ